MISAATLGGRAVTIFIIGCIMRPHFRFVFVVLFFTAVLIFAVYLRNVNNRIFYQLYTLEAEQSWLIQELTHKQLQVESLINPASASEHLDRP